MIRTLVDFLQQYQRLLALTGAGVSTGSGIPDYRDTSGAWKQRRPMEYREFVDQHQARQRYWARSFVGWQRFRLARPGAAHLALARLETMGKLAHTVTQNVDGLHLAAGSRRLTELHGSLARVVCLDCGTTQPRARMQQRLQAVNPVLAGLSAPIAPDGDAWLDDLDTRSIVVPACDQCGGVLKPTVVFFGETLMPGSADRCNRALDDADALLIVGTSLMVFSGYRLVRDAVRAGRPVFLLNRGKTRADDLITMRLDADCGPALARAVDSLSVEGPPPEPVVM